jgi:two-component system cell cycle response regulator
MGAPKDEGTGGPSTHAGDPDRTSDLPAAADSLMRSPSPPGLTSGVRSIAKELLPTGATPQMAVSSEFILDRATLTMFAGPDIGAVFALGSPEIVLGRGVEATVQLDEPSVSRCHAKISRMGPDSYVIEDLGSTNGTYVGGRRIRSATLQSGDRVQLGRECVFRFAVVDESEESLQRRLYERSMRDELTGVGNRRCLFERLASELAHARREKRALSLLFLDVDHFKVINDTFGHIVGDRTLRAISARCEEVVRGGDLFARYGGEEFAVIARDADHAEALVLAERLRVAIAEVRVETQSGAISVTVSIGLVSLSESDASSDGLALIARADARLYAAMADATEFAPRTTSPSLP